MRNIDPAPDDETERFVAAIYADQREADRREADRREADRREAARASSPE